MQFINKKTKRKITSILPGKRKASPVPHLVKSNDIPSDTEIILVQNALTKAREELEVLGYQLGQTNATHHDTLNKDKKSCLKFIQAHTAVLSLIRRIPDDILATIFDEVSFSPRAYYSHPPWSLSQVCRNWRALALSLPNLWKCIDLKLDVERLKTHAFLLYLTNHLDRSKHVPLDIFVSCSSSIYDYVHHPFIDILCRYAERWGSVSLVVSGTTLQAFAGVKGRLKMLHTVSMFLVTSGPYHDGAPLDMFEDAPELRRFSMNGHVSSLSVRLPWRQLLSYEGMFGNRTGIVNALTSPRLESLALNHNRHFDNGVPLPTMTLNSLKRLSVACIPLSNWHDINAKKHLDGLTLPALKELRFIHYGVPTASCVTALIRRFKCLCLTSLELSPLTPFEPGELAGVLRLTPQLTDFVIYLQTIDDIRDLVLQDDPSAKIVPSLQRLIIHIPSLDDRDRCREMLALAVSRCETARPMLLRVVVYDMHYWHEAHEKLEAAAVPDRVAYASTPSAEQTQAVAELTRWIETLHLLLGKPVRDGPIARALDIAAPPAMNSKEFEKSVSELMASLEQMRFDDHWSFHEVGLHHRLYHIVHVIDAEKSEQRGNFRHWKERAEKLLDKWNELYVYPSLEHRRWAFQGFHSFVYVPLNHESRKVVPNALKMVYGKTFFAGKYHTPDAVQPSDVSQLVYHD